MKCIEKEEEEEEETLYISDIQLYMIYIYVERDRDIDRDRHQYLLKQKHGVSSEVLSIDFVIKPCVTCKDMKKNSRK